MLIKLTPFLQPSFRPPKVVGFLPFVKPSYCKVFFQQQHLCQMTVKEVLTMSERDKSRGVLLLFLPLLIENIWLIFWSEKPVSFSIWETRKLMTLFWFWRWLLWRALIKKTGLYRFKAALRHSFSACVYCTYLHFQSNYFVLSEPT